MISSEDLNRSLTMSAWAGYVELRSYQSRNPDSDSAQSLMLLRSSRADNSSLDFDGALLVESILGSEVRAQKILPLLRQTVCELIVRANPWWLILVPGGLDKVREAIGVDQLQCLEEAGLFDQNSETALWWDEIASRMRGESDAAKMQQAREAERLSMQFEKNRLERLGIRQSPEWIALRDNTLGYDISSFDLAHGKVVSRLIEVKSSRADRMFISKNEWLNAASAKNAYRFHYWKFPEKLGSEFGVDAIEAHIPNDRGKGDWRAVLIPASGVKMHHLT